MHLRLSRPRFSLLLDLALKVTVLDLLRVSVPLWFNIFLAKHTTETQRHREIRSQTDFQGKALLLYKVSFRAYPKTHPHSTKPKDFGYGRIFLLDHRH